MVTHRDTDRFLQLLKKLDTLTALAALKAAGKAF